MPNLPHDSHLGTEDLRTYLEGVLPGSRLTNATVDAAYKPLLLLQSTHILAAFAFTNGEMLKSYEILYSSFKKYYADQHGQWDALDLAFVFCVRPDVPDMDSFCSKIETDVYFCRKFVVPLAAPLDASLACLPFLPLTPFHGRSLRPPSAQTFLQQCGVPAVLAKYLVVHGERSPAGIVDDCLSGTFGEPRDLKPTLNAPVEHMDRATETIRLESVVIKEFRAYRKQQSFAVGADVTILYGPNGFGKTSFFDAIDFAMTGEIGRFKTATDANFKKTAKHLDSGSEESVVSLSFICNGATRKLTRRVSDRKKALLDGRTSERKTILSELTGGEFTTADRVENFVSLFRATHLFSQEHQELTNDFQDTCCLSEQIVSRMLAFEDYTNAVNKAAKVNELVQNAIANADKEIKELSEQIDDEKNELDRLGQSSKANTNVGALDAEIASLRCKVSEAGISVAPEEPDAAAVRGWRASLEARNAESKSRTDRLSVLAKEAAGLPRMLDELASLRQQLAKNEQALIAADEKRIATELGLQRTEQRLAEMTAKRAAAQTHAELLEWIRTTKPVYAQILERQKEVTEELNRATAALTQHRASEAKAVGCLRTQENLAAQADERLATKRAEFIAVQALNQTTAAWQDNHTRLVAIDEAEQGSLSSLKLLRAEERELSPQVVALAAEEARLSRQVAEVDQRQSELKKLLSQLQGHVRDGTCPLCGEDHGSKDELILRIQQHLATDAASAARVDLAEVQNKARQLEELVAKNKEQREITDANITSLKNERAKLITEIGKFSDSMAKLGIFIEASGPTPAEQLHTRENRVQQEVTDLNRQIQEIGDKLQAARIVLADIRDLAAAMAAKVAEREAALMRIQEEANRLRKDPRLTQVSLDIEPAQLAELERLNLQDLASFNAEAVKAEMDAAQKKPQVSTLRQESASLKAQLPALRNQLANVQRAVTEITARLAESQLSPDVSEATLLALIAEESRAQAQFLALRDSAANIELAIDAATTAAALTQLLQNVRNKEKAVVAATRKHDQYQPWLKYFDVLSRLVLSQKSEAITHFTREYGPRTSVIQRRLRSVYGFDEIEIQSQESTIRVRVRRHGEELRPTDYFSQSQQQTLLLCLFLTAGISQTWSGFSPVFLDDPVTHFDDLNTYAFLDLIVGLLESDIGKRQFVISTCDEKLLQLARQKFRYLRGRAKFYRFSAIGADGPIIEEITYP